MPNSTTITETTAAAAGPENLTAVSAQNSASDWLEGSPSPKNDHDRDDKGAQDAFTEIKEPLIPRIFPVYAFI
jgi:hypothetical protein